MKSTVRNLTPATKAVIAILSVIVLIFASILFWIGIANWLGDDSDDYGQSSGTSFSDDELWSTEEMAYLVLLYEAHAEDGDRGHTFASDGYAVIHGHTVCELLDTYYIETIADSVARNNEGILWKVSDSSKAYGIVAAALHLCPEHAEEVYDWAYN